MEQLSRMGQALRRIRLERGDRQADLAARLGVSRQTVARMERGDPATAIGPWLLAAEIYGLEGTWQDVMEQPEDPFADYDRRQAEARSLARRRARRRT